LKKKKRVRGKTGNCRDSGPARRENKEMKTRGTNSS